MAEDASTAQVHRKPEESTGVVGFKQLDIAGGIPRGQIPRQPQTYSEQVVNFLRQNNQAQKDARHLEAGSVANYNGQKWSNIGKELYGMKPQDVQYALALQPPYHLASFLKLTGNSTKGISDTGKNTMVFVVMQGEVTVVMNTSKFVVRRGDSFFVPPQNTYNITNMRACMAELFLVQYKYECSLLNSETGGVEDKKQEGSETSRKKKIDERMQMNEQRSAEQRDKNLRGRVKEARQAEKKEMKKIEEKVRQAEERAMKKLRKVEEDVRQAEERGMKKIMKVEEEVKQAEERGMKKIREMEEGVRRAEEREKKKIEEEVRRAEERAMKKLTEMASADSDYDCSASWPKCIRPTGPHVYWVQCDTCDLWYHMACIGLEQSQVSEEEDFNCRNCVGKDRNCWAAQRLVGKKLKQEEENSESCAYMDTESILLSEEDFNCRNCVGKDRSCWAAQRLVGKILKQEEEESGSCAFMDTESILLSEEEFFED